MISILTSIKKLLGIAEDYTHFDYDIIAHINTAFMTLTQIGVGPSDGFSISDKNATWNDFIPEGSSVKAEWLQTYVYLQVKLVFDPPNGSVLDSYTRRINELEVRLNHAVECSE